jgi:hypothetical protein
VNPLQALQSGSFGKLNQNTPLLTLDKEALEIQISNHSLAAQ